MGFVVQSCWCLVWSSFNMPFGFSPPIDFCYPSNIIKILGIPFKFISFNLFFSPRHVGQKCSPCTCTSKVRGCPNNFWNHFSMFCPKNLFVSFPPPCYWPFNTACHFWHDLCEGLWEIHGSRFLDCPQVPLGVLIIFFPYLSGWGGRGEIIFNFIEFIGSMTYLGHLLHLSLLLNFYWIITHFYWRR